MVEDADEPISLQAFWRFLALLAEALRQMNDAQGAERLLGVLSDQISALENNPKEFHLLREDCVELSRIHVALVDHYFRPQVSDDQG